MATSVIAVLVVAAGLAALAGTGGGKHSPLPEPTPVDARAMQQWWSGARQHFTDLQTALDNSRRALDRHDGPGLEAACQQMHDNAAVELPAHLPTPEPDLTSELKAATDDAHAAAHMCLSAVAGSINNYHGEFVANLDQAGRHLAAAQDLINRILTATS